MVPAGFPWTSYPFYNVRAFGAAGDGTTDDTAPLKAALLAAGSSAADGSTASVFVPTGTYQISSQLTVPLGVRLIGESNRGSRIRIAAGFPASTALIRMGSGTGAIFGTAIDTLFIECSGATGSIGILSSDIQDQCYIRNVIVNNWVAYGIQIDGSLGTFGSVNSFEIQQVELYKAAAGGNNTGIGLYLANGSFGILVQSVSVASTAGNAFQYGIQNTNCPFIGIGLRFDVAGLEGVRVGSGGPIALKQVTGNSTTTLIHITNQASLVTCEQVYLFGTGTNVLIDDGVGNTPAGTYTDNMIAYYQRTGLFAPTLLQLPVLDGLTLLGQRLAGPSVVVLADAATIATSALLGNAFAVTVAGNRTIGLPSGLRNGQRLHYTIIQDGTGGRTIAWHASFKKTWSDAGNTAGKRSTIAFIYDGSVLNQDGAQTPYVL